MRAVIDSHAHTFLRGPEDLERMAQAGVRGVVVCAFLPVAPSGASTLVDVFRWVGREEPARLERAGLRAKVALGIHPRCIPARGLGEVLEALGRALEDGWAAAVGEVGLETGEGREAEVLLEQLRLAASCGVPVIVHTPRSDKERVFRLTEMVVEASGIDPGLVVLDHLTPELAVRARALGATAGLTLQPGKTTPEQVVRLIAEHGSEGLVANSDLSHARSDPLAVPGLAARLVEAGIDAVDVERVTWANAAALMRF